MDQFPIIWFSFVQPTMLWLALLVVPLWLLAWYGPRKLAPRRFWASLLVRTALIFALVLALAGIQMVRPVADVATIFLIDRSDSVSPAAAARAEQFVRDALLAKAPEDRAGVVLFGQNALVEQVASESSDLAPWANLPGGTSTNIQQATELGLSLFPDDANKRMVLLSDGAQNTGNALQAAQLALARNVAISYVDLGGDTQQGEVLLAGLEAPARVREGQSLTLNATVESTVAQTAHLRVFSGETAVFDQDIQLQAGTNVLPINVQASSAGGFQQFRAEITPQADAQPKNNTAEALVRVDGSPRVLLVEGTPGEGQPLRDALLAAGVTAELVAPAALPADVAGLANYESIALINVPATAVPIQTQQNIASYVRDLGRGFTMIGGDASFGIGGYTGTPIADALPVTIDPRDQTEHPKVAIVYVLDKSRSMQNCHCNGPNRETDTDRAYFENGRMKLDIAKDGVMKSVATLSPQDEVGILTFDGSAHLQLPVQGNVTPEKVLQIIGPIPPNGTETNVSSGLQAAYDMLLTSDAKIKHIVIVTDGWGEGGDPINIANNMRAAGMTLSVVADGPGAAPALQQLAAAGGGRFFPVNNPEEIQTIFVDDTIQIAGNYMVEAPFTPAYGMPSPVLDGLDAGLPQLYGYNATVAKQSATVALYGLDDAPVLAQWQYGLGRTVAWTSDSKGQWAKDWITWAGFPRFAAQMIGWTLPTDLNAGLAPNISTADGTLHIDAQLSTGDASIPAQVTASLVGANGTQTIPLAQTGPGQFQAQVPLPEQGSYIVQMVAAQNGQPIAQASAGLALPYSAEYGLEQHDPTLLATLAQITGGSALTTPAEAFAPAAGTQANRAQDIARWLLIAALCLLPLDILLRRMFVASGRVR